MKSSFFVFVLSLGIIAVCSLSLFAAVKAADAAHDTKAAAEPLKSTHVETVAKPAVNDVKTNTEVHDEGSVHVRITSISQDPTTGKIHITVNDHRDSLHVPHAIHHKKKKSFLHSKDNPAFNAVIVCIFVFFWVFMGRFIVKYAGTHPLPRNYEATEFEATHMFESESDDEDNGL